MQRLADSSKALALVVGKRVHRVQDHRPDARLFEFSRKVLAIQIEKDRIEKTLGLAAGGAGGDNDVLAVNMRCADGPFLMDVQQVDFQSRQKLFASSRKTLLRQPPCAYPFREVPRPLGNRTFQQSSFFPQRGLKRVPQVLFLEEKRSFQIIFVSLANLFRPLFHIVCVRHRSTFRSSRC